MHMSKMNHWSIICSCKNWKLTQAFLGECMNLAECYAAVKKEWGRTLLTKHTVKWNGRV